MPLDAPVMRTIFPEKSMETLMPESSSHRKAFGQAQVYRNHRTLPSYRFVTSSDY